MKRLALILGLSLAILATSAPVSAQRMGMRFGGGGVHGGVGVHGFMGGRFAGGRFAGGQGFGRPIAPPFARRPFFGKRFGGFAFVLPVPIGFGAWSPFYGYPYGYPPPYGGYPGGYGDYPVAYDLPAASRAYDPPPLLTVPTAQAVPPVPPPPMPQVVEFSTGRYELREDSGGTAYSWVWIPNPPSAPPGQLDPNGQSIPPPQRPPVRLYRWTDDQGVVHLTNLWDEVPPQYRQQVKPPETS